MAQEFIALGHDGDAYGGLETFPNPGVAVGEREGDELTAMCPITNQPDNYVTTIRYRPDAFCLESKSVKIYLSRFRNACAFCESRREQIRDHVGAALHREPSGVDVTLVQKRRGGIV